MYFRQEWLKVKKVAGFRKQTVEVCFVGKRKQSWETQHRSEKAGWRRGEAEQLISPSCWGLPRGAFQRGQLGCAESCWQSWDCFHTDLLSPPFLEVYICLHMCVAWCCEACSLKYNPVDNEGEAYSNMHLKFVSFRKYCFVNILRSNQSDSPRWNCWNLRRENRY